MRYLLVAVLVVAIAVISLAQYVPTAACLYTVAKVTTTSCNYITEAQTTVMTITYVTNATTTTSVVTTTITNTYKQCHEGIAGAVANMTCTWNVPPRPSPPPAGSWGKMPTASTFADYAVAALALGLIFASFATTTSEMSNNYMIAAIAMFVLASALASLSPVTAVLSALSGILALISVLIFLRRK